MSFNQYYEPDDYENAHAPEDDRDCDECERCGEIEILTDHKVEGMICGSCLESALEADSWHAYESRATRHAENGYGYSGGWSGFEPHDVGGW